MFILIIVDNVTVVTVVIAVIVVIVRVVIVVIAIIVVIVHMVIIMNNHNNYICRNKWACRCAKHTCPIPFITVGSFVFDCRLRIQKRPNYSTVLLFCTDGLGMSNIVAKTTKTVGT